MKLTLTELNEQLVKLGYPVAYYQFKSAKEPPFIVYLVLNSDTFNADNVVLTESVYVDIELYVTNKSLAIEDKIKNMLKENELSWSYDEIYIEDERVFKCTFSTKLIN